MSGWAAWALPSLLALSLIFGWQDRALGWKSGLLALLYPSLILFLLACRAWFGPLPAPWSFWVPAVLLVVVALSAQGLLAADDAVAAAKAMGRAQIAWCVFGISLSAPLGASGALLLLWQQGLLTQPLSRVLERSPGRIVLVALLFLALAGGPPFSAFNAYFQLLAPLMTEGAAVNSMQAKLFSGTGLLAVLAILALLYQTGAMGYFYWSRVLPSAISAEDKAAGLRPLPEPWAWACLGLSLAWGLAEHWGLPGHLALEALRGLHVLPPN